jgi:3,5-epimerase/4-reductase
MDNKDLLRQYVDTGLQLTEYQVKLLSGNLLQTDTESNEEIYTSDIRVDNEKLLRNEIEKIKPDRIISVIGRTHGPGYSTIDYLEQKGKLVENVRDNLYSPIILGLLCKEYNIHLTHINTGCIFSYDDTHTTTVGFTEDSNPNFFGSSYSIVKGFTDRLIKQINGPILMLRIRMPITAEVHPRNFITKITNYKKICSIDNSMTVLPELLPIMIDMAKRNITGTINFTNPGVISHNEILEMYREIIDPSFTWENFSLEEQSQILASERSNNYLDTSQLQSMYPNVKNIKDSIREILYDMKKSLT